MSRRPERPAGVLFLTDQLGRGGSERQLFLLASHLDRRQFQPMVGVMNPSPHAVYDRPLAERGIPVIHLPKGRAGLPGRMLRLGREMAGRKPRIVHSWTVHDNPYAGLVGAVARVPVRWGSLRGSFHSEALRRMPGPLRRLTLTSVQRVLVNSRALRDELVAEGLAPERVPVLPNCVELPSAEPPPADLGELGVPTGAPVVVIVANLRRVKNLDLFVDAMARLLPARPEVHGVVVGQALPSEPEVPGELAGRIAAAGLGHRIHLTGFRNDVPRLLARSTVTCLTSHSEGSPNVVLEAMALGRPVVATRVGGVPDLVREGISGLLVPPGDPEAFAAAVARLLDHPETARRMGEAGQKIARGEHSPESAAGRLGELYDHALGSAGGGR